MRSHLVGSGSVELGFIGQDTRKRLDHLSASWLEYSPDSSSLVVRHVQPDDAPALRELAGELLDFLHTISDAERAQIPGGALYYQEESTGQYVRLRVWAGGFLTVAWARPDYTRAQWEAFRNQPITLVFEPFQRLNGTVNFDGNSNADEQLRKIIDNTAGQYSEGDYAVNSSPGRIELSFRDFNADALTVINAVRYLAKAGTLNGEVDVSSFRAGDLEDYCRFAFRAGETWIARPILWPDTPER